AAQFLGAGALLQSRARAGRRAGQGQPMIFFTALLAFVALAGIGFVVTADNSPKKRVQAIAKAEGGRAAKAAAEGPQKRRNLTTVLKDMEKKQASPHKQEKPTMRRRLEQ